MKNRCVGVGVLTFFFLAATAFAAVTYSVTDVAKVYLGNPNAKFTQPSTVVIQTVFDSLPSYKEALKHPEGSAKRIHWLKKASDEFRELLAKVSKDKKYDLVAELGAISGTDSSTKKPVEIPDITTDVVAAIPAK